MSRNGKYSNHCTLFRSTLSKFEILLFTPMETCESMSQYVFLLLLGIFDVMLYASEFY